MPQFDFAISFARTERILARSLAEALGRVGLRVFFDEHFEHEMLGQDGADYLNRVFFEQSRYCVALVSATYEQRPWAQLERRAAQAKEQVSGQGVLLPILVDATRPAWLLPTRMYFDLAERTLPELVELLRRKHTAEDPATFREVARLSLPSSDGPFVIAPGWEHDDFVVWCTSAADGDRQVIRLVPAASGGTWGAVDIPMKRKAGWLLPGDGGSLVGIPDMSSGKIEVFEPMRGVVTTHAPNRPYRWGSATDCKAQDGAVLIAYCGGDVWHLSTALQRLTELRPGTDEVQYTYVDFWKDEFVVALEERYELEVRRLSDGALVRTLASPVAAEGLSCYPEADLIAVTGLESVATLRLSSGAVIGTEEIIGQTFSSSTSRIDIALNSMFRGAEFMGSVAQTINVEGSRKLVWRRTPRSQGWATLAVSPSGRMAAAVTKTHALLYERRP